MTRHARRVHLAIAAAILSIVSILEGQTEGTLGLGASVVEYQGFLASSAFVFAPALRYDSPRISFAGQASLTMFESGNRVIQSSIAAGWLAGSGSRWRLQLSGSAGTSSYTDHELTVHLLGGVRLHRFGQTSGGWIGFNTGASSGEPGGAAAEATVAGWTVKHRFAFVGTTTATWQGPVKVLDLIGTIHWTGRSVEVEARAGARPWMEGEHGVGSAEVFGEVTALVPLNRWLAVSAAAGTYPSDPVRRSLGASYVSAGLRLRSTGRSTQVLPFQPTGLPRERAVPTEADGPPLEIAGSGEVRTLRVRAADAQSVKVMADFTDWTPVRLTRVASGVWEAELAIPPGVHRVNVRLNGGPWSAPGGVRLEQTEFGGAVGVVVVP